MERRQHMRLSRCLAAFAFALALHATSWAQTPTAGGDARRGEAAYQARCSACHSADANRIGPSHRGVVGRRAGAVTGYAYSSALSASGLVWSPGTLDRWLAGPTRLVPGTRMGVSVPDAQQRRDIIAYLETLRAN